MKWKLRLTICVLVGSGLSYCSSEKKSRRHLRAPDNSQEIPGSDPTTPGSPDGPDDGMSSSRSATRGWWESITGFIALLGTGEEERAVWLVSRQGDAGPFTWSRLISSHEASSTREDARTGIPNLAGETDTSLRLHGPMWSMMGPGTAGKGEFTTTFLAQKESDLGPQIWAVQGLTQKTNLDFGEHLPSEAPPAAAAWSIFETTPREAAGLLMTHAARPGPSGTILTTLIGVRSTNGRSLLLAVQSSQDQTLAQTSIEETSPDETYESLALTYDSQSVLHATYVRGGKLFSRVFREKTSSEEAGWSSARSLAVACERVSHVVATRGTKDLPLALAYTCDTGAGCALGFAGYRGNTLAGPIDTVDELVALTQKGESCLPFSYAKPSLAVTQKNQDDEALVHIATLMRTDAVPGSSPRWDIGFTNAGIPSLAFSPLQALPESQDIRGFPKIHLGPQERVSIAFVTARDLKLATQGEDGRFSLESLGDGSPFFSDMAAPGDAEGTVVPHGTILDFSAIQTVEDSFF